jgi:hypothetical protein
LTKIKAQKTGLYFYKLIRSKPLNMPTTNHPTTNQTINDILTVTEFGRWYYFGELWSPAYKYVQAESAAFNASQLRRCLKSMVDTKLLRPINKVPFDITQADWNTQVTLTEFGDEVRENGGWLKYLETNTELVRLQLANERAKRSRFWITACLTVVSLFLVCLDIYQSNKKRAIEAELQLGKEKIESLSRNLSSLDSLVKTKDKQIRQLNQRIDSFKRPFKPKK